MGYTIAYDGSIAHWHAYVDFEFDDGITAHNVKTLRFGKWPWILCLLYMDGIHATLMVY